jgi:hypothetical protein
MVLPVSVLKIGHTAQSINFVLKLKHVCRLITCGTAIRVTHVTRLISYGVRHFP